MLNAHVDEVIIEGGRARGVSLQGGSRVLASKAVVSNASLWDTQKLLPASAVTPKMIQDAAVRPCPFCAHSLDGKEFVEFKVVTLK